MKKIAYLTILLAGAVLTACSSVNSARLATAGAYALTGLTISDAQVMQLSAEAVRAMDLTGNVAPAGNAYAQRLARLTSGIKEVDGIPLNFKVYLTRDINAFATGDGSVRVYSGLMDVMDDSELMAIVGHEIGHVAHSDSKNNMRTIYLAYAAKEALASTGNVAASLSDSQLGELGVSLAQAQYSQKQEFAADEYGMNFSIRQGYSPYSMYNALSKLSSASGGTSGGGKLLYLFSSHPDTAERIKRMKEKADNYRK